MTHQLFENNAMKWTPYSQREKWADIQPIPDADDHNSDVASEYRRKYREVLGYFRAVVAAEEKTIRVLELTEDAMCCSPDNPAVWKYRRTVLEALGWDLRQELDYIEEILPNHAENYQFWHHRRLVVLVLNDGSRELSVTEKAIGWDNNNYQAWHHRQWAIRTFRMYSKELQFVTQLIGEDVRNRHAWSQRYFVVKSLGFTRSIITREMFFAMKKIRIVKTNEHAWNYLQAMLKESDAGMFRQTPSVIEFCESLYNDGCRSPHLQALLIKIYEARCSMQHTSEGREFYAVKVYDLCHDMAQKYDILGRAYWQNLVKKLRTKLANREFDYIEQCPLSFNF